MAHRPSHGRMLACGRGETDGPRCRDSAAARRHGACNRLYSAALPGDGSERLRLDAQHLPHVTLTQHFVKYDELDGASCGDRRGARTSAPACITITGGGQSAHTLWMTVERTPELLDLHGRLMQALKGLERTAGDAHAFFEGGGRVGDVHWVAAFRQNSSFGAFTPHITLGHGERPPAVEPSPSTRRPLPRVTSVDSARAGGCCARGNSRRGTNRQGPTSLISTDRLQDDVRHHVEKQRIVVDRLGPGHRQPDVAAHRAPPRYRGRTAPRCDRRRIRSGIDDRGRQSLVALAAQVIAHVRRQPGILRPAAAALIHQRPVASSPAASATRRAVSSQLLAIARPLRHRQRNAVRRAHQSG